mgnify:CR=1 FL=1
MEIEEMITNLQATVNDLITQVQSIPDQSDAIAALGTQLADIKTELASGKDPDPDPDYFTKWLEGGEKNED